MAGKVLKAAVVGGSTLLGRELLSEVASSAAALWDLQVLEEGDEAEGQLTSSGEEALVVHALEASSFRGADLVFFAGTPEQTKRFLQAALDASAAVVDLTGMAESEPGFLLKCPWLQRGQRADLTTLGMVVPHPVAQLLATVCERLQESFGRTTLTATVLEPASQAGAAGVDELHQQTVGLLSFQEVPKEVFGKQVAFNLQATLGKEVRVRLGEVRSRIGRELAVLVPGEPVSFSLLQAPTFHGYFISAHLAFSRSVPMEEVERVLSGTMLTLDSEQPPSNQAAVESGEVLLSIGEDPGRDDAYWLLLAADNLRLTARTAVQLGQELAALRPDSRVQ